VHQEIKNVKQVWQQEHNIDIADCDNNLTVPMIHGINKADLLLT
jgi:hypothetical protein